MGVYYNMTGIEIYLLIVLPLHTMDEAYHCNNIPLVGNDNDKHLVCNWAEDDYLNELIPRVGVTILLFVCGLVMKMLLNYTLTYV